MIEVELKAVLSSLAFDATRIKLKTMKFRLAKRAKESDLYFNGISRDFKFSGEALRIRRAENIDTGKRSASITYKGQKLDNRSQSRRELEVSIQEPGNAENILLALGFTVFSTVTKVREVYSRGDIIVCLDKVDEVGQFIELEQLIDDVNDKGLVIDKMRDIFLELAVSREQLTDKSYLELLWDKQLQDKID